MLGVLTFITILSTSFTYRRIGIGPATRFGSGVLALRTTRSMRIIIGLSRPTMTTISVPMRVAYRSRTCRMSSRDFSFTRNKSDTSVAIASTNLPTNRDVALGLLSIRNVRVKAGFAYIVAGTTPGALICGFNSTSISLMTNNATGIALDLARSNTGFITTISVGVPIILRKRNGS